MPTVMAMSEEIVLRMDRATTEDLADLIHDVGEHLAAGIPLMPLEHEANERLGRLLKELRHALGKRCDPWCTHLDSPDGEHDRGANPGP
jgi:hypothetical protein